MSAASCREVLARHSKSFALAARLLPSGIADDAAIVYAFCRRADDAIDLGTDGLQALLRLRAEVDSIYAGAPQDDGQLRAFQEVVGRRAIPRVYVDELIDGMEMDVRGARYRSLDDLLVYCHRVAGTVGLMMCHVLGVRRPPALRRAAHLGIAMQLTNICRDVAEDWRNGRLYLPASLLGSCSRPSGAFPSALRVRARLAIGVLLAEAEGYYRSGDAGIDLLGWRCALAVRTARLVYAAIGDRIQRSGCDPLAGRAVVPTWRKLLLAGKALLQTLSRIRFRRPAPLRPELVLRFPDDVLPL